MSGGHGIRRSDDPNPRSGVDERGEWSPAFPGQRPPFAPGNEHAAEAPVTHGVYSKRRLLAAAEQEYAQLRLTFTPWDPAYELPARTLAEIRARTVLAYIHLDEVDLVDDQSEVRAILKELPRWERRATELYRELALTVRSRVELDLDRIARERGMIELAEVNEILAVYREVMTDVLPSKLRPVFLEKLKRRLASLGESSRGDAHVVEGSARRLEPLPVDEEGLGGA